MRIWYLAMTTVMMLFRVSSPLHAQPVATSPVEEFDSGLIDKAEFDAAIPTLDPELEHPLQSLDGFAKQMDAEAALAPAMVPTQVVDPELTSP